MGIVDYGNDEIIFLVVFDDVFNGLFYFRGFFFNKGFLGEIIIVLIKCFFKGFGRSVEI